MPKKLTEEHKRNIRRSCQGINKGNKRSDLVKLNKKRKGKSWESIYGKTQAKSMRMNRSKKVSGKNNPNFEHYKYNITRKFLVREYAQIKNSMKQIAKKVNCSYEVIRQTLIRYSIKIRTKSEAHKGIIHSCSEESKRKMSLARGGTGIPYELNEYGAEFDDALKEQVRFRDKYKCQICGCTQLENGKQLDCHHIDYNKKNNVLNNLIALCHRCHTKTNVNRKYWMKFLKEKLLCRQTLLI